jgi:hypothetical protein
MKYFSYGVNEISNIYIILKIIQSITVEFDTIIHTAKIFSGVYLNQSPE